MMHRFGFRFLIGALALGLAVVSALPAQAEKRVALVIGNDNYAQVAQLRNAVNDSRTIGAALQKLGFTVTFAENLSRRRMSEELIAFDRLVEKGDVAVFFFSGHGFEIQGENYLLPIDVPAAVEGQEELIRDSSFGAQRLIERLQVRGARTTVAILDACRNNPFEKPGVRSVGGSAGLAAMTASEGVFVMFSAGVKQTALDRLTANDPNPNSVFTRNFVQELATPGLTLVQVAKRTQLQVRQLASSIGHNQTPAYYDQIVGDVVLNGSAADSPTVAPLPQIAAVTPGEQRMVPIRPPLEEPINAPLANFMRTNSGWVVTLSFVDTVTAIQWRLGDTGDFRETGFVDAFDARTRKRIPNPSFELDTDQGEATIYVKFADLRGKWADPYPILFNPTAALERSERGILESTKGAWLAFRDFNGTLLYYTHLVSYRCAIRRVRIGIDTPVPEKVVALPPCNLRAPNEIPSNVQPYMKLPSSTRSVSIELTYRDGTTSEIKTFRK